MVDLISTINHEAPLCFQLMHSLLLSVSGNDIQNFTDYIFNVGLKAAAMRATGNNDQFDG